LVQQLCRTGNGFTGKTVDMPCYSPTNASLRSPSKYWVVSDAQFKRDLVGRTLRDIYRENKLGRVDGLTNFSPAFGKYEPRQLGGRSCAMSPRNGVCLEVEYALWCKARNHTPHPASIDGDHPQNCHRLKAPKAERISPAKDVLQFHVNRLIAAGSPVITEMAA
jgi:hypothetical protein